MSQISRPTALEWSKSLKDILLNKQLARCDVYPNDYRHIRFAGMACPRCQLDRVAEVAKRTKLISVKPQVTEAPDSTPSVTVIPPQAKVPIHAGHPILFYLVIGAIVVLMFLALTKKPNDPVSRPLSSWNQSANPSTSSQPSYNSPPLVPQESKAKETSTNSQSRVSNNPNTNEKKETAVISKNNNSISTLDNAPVFDKLTQDIQRELSRLGFSVGPIDGFYGSLTNKAISEFQKQNGFPVDGMVSNRLLSFLRTIEQSSDRSVSSSPRDSSSSSETPNRPSPALRQWIGNVSNVHPSLGYFEISFVNAPRVIIDDIVYVENAGVRAKISRVLGDRGSAIVIGGSINSVKANNRVTK